MNIPTSQCSYSHSNKVRLRHTDTHSEFTDEEPQHRQTQGICLHDKGEYSWAGIRRDSSGLKDTKLCYSRTSKSRQTQCMGSGAPQALNCLFLSALTDLHQPAQGQQEPWLEFLPETKLFVSPSGSWKNTNRYFSFHANILHFLPYSSIISDILLQVTINEKFVPSFHRVSAAWISALNSIAPVTVMSLVILLWATWKQRNKHNHTFLFQVKKNRVFVELK